MQVGRDFIDGELQPIYEFRHLTFQEYLAARGFAKEEYPGRNDAMPLADVLEPYFQDENWIEVIPLAAVIAGRKAEGLIERIVTAARIWLQHTPNPLALNDRPAMLLHRCIRDEIQLPSKPLRAALAELARHVGYASLQAEEPVVPEILRGKFGSLFQEIVEEKYLAGDGEYASYANAMAATADFRFLADQRSPAALQASLELASRVFDSGTRLEQIRAAFTIMGAASRWEHPRDSVPHETYEAAVRGLGKLLDAGDIPGSLAASWALSWTGAKRLTHSPPSPAVMVSLYRFWRMLQGSDLHWVPAYAFFAQKLLPRDSFPLEVWGDCEDALREPFASASTGLHSARLASIVVGWYRRSPWSDPELAALIRNIGSPFVDDPTLGELLNNLGESGGRVLEEWEQTRRTMLERRHTRLRRRARPSVPLP